MLPRRWPASVAHIPWLKVNLAASIVEVRGVSHKGVLSRNTGALVCVAEIGGAPAARRSLRWSGGMQMLSRPQIILAMMSVSVATTSSDSVQAKVKEIYAAQQIGSFNRHAHGNKLHLRSQPRSQSSVTNTSPLPEMLTASTHADERQLTTTPEGRLLDLSQPFDSSASILPSKSWRLRLSAALLAAATAMQGGAMGFHVRAMFGGDEPPPHAFEALVAASVMLLTLLGALWSMVTQLLIWSEPMVQGEISQV